MAYKFKIGDKVKIITGSIENGFLKESCRRLLGKVGTIVEGINNPDTELSVDFKDVFTSWIIPIEALEFVSNKDFIEGEVIYFEYEHNYNSRSRAMRYKRGLFLAYHHYNKNKVYVILQGLHGGSYNKTVTFCEIDRIYKEREIKKK